MRRRATFGLGCLLLVACKDKLPANAPQFRVEVAASDREQSFFCSFVDDPLNDTLALASVEEPALQADPAVCMRFTILKTDGTPVTDTLAESSCAIKPQQALGGESGGVALSLKSEDIGGPIGLDQQYLIRTDLFKDGALVETGLVGSFALNEVEEDTARALTLMDLDQLSCIIPSDFAKGRNPQLPTDITESEDGQGDQGVALIDSRGFHAASTVGSYANGEAEGVLVSGGIKEIRENVGAPVAIDDSRLLDTFEIFNRTEMRYIPQDNITLTIGRAFHQSFTLPTREDEIQVVLVGGTTSKEGIGRKHELFANLGNGILNPLPLLPLTFFPQADVAGAFSITEDPGAELVTLDKNLNPVASEELVDVPGRFGAASINDGEHIIYFGGIATNTLQDPDGNAVDNCEDFATNGKTLTDFLCNNGVVLERGLTNDASNFAATVSETSMGVSRIGASVVSIDDDPQTPPAFLLIGGALSPTGGAADAAKIAQLVTLDEATNTLAYQDLTISGIDPTLINRAFFGLARIPGTTDKFALFGGERIDPAATGNLVDDTVDPIVRGVPNIAALLTLTGTALAVEEVQGPSIGGVPLTRPSVDGALLNFPKFEQPADFDYDDLDLFDEDQTTTILNAQGQCNSALTPCTNSNLGERIAYPMVVAGPNNSILFAGGVRGELFPQDAILQFSLDGVGAPVLREVPNPGDPNCVDANNDPSDCSLHLFRRVFGGAAVALPDLGTGKTIMFIGGVEGVSVPINDDLAFFDLPEKGALAARRDTSFFLFEVPTQENDIIDACQGNEEELFTESEACGFANSSLKPRRLFFIPIGGAK